MTRATRLGVLLVVLCVRWRHHPSCAAAASVAAGEEAAQPLGRATAVGSTDRAGWRKVDGVRSAASPRDDGDALLESSHGWRNGDEAPWHLRQSGTWAKGPVVSLVSRAGRSDLAWSLVV